MHILWKMPQEKPKQAREISEAFDLHPAAASVLAARGWQVDTLEPFFTEQALEDPFALTDMQKAVDRINRAIESNEVVAVYGDYDCDGITSCYIVYQFLFSLGLEVLPYIPEREEGYGMTKETLLSLKEQGASLIITVDNGITAIEEADYCESIGVDLIITDHHTVGDTLPRAVAVVNPKRKEDKERCYPDLAGVGVAFKLIAAMQDGDYESTFEQFGEFAAMGTISDVMPLTGENRTIVKKGLAALRYSENTGLHTLLSAIHLSPEAVTAEQIGFRIAPLINAAGRMGEAKDAWRLLCAEDEQEATAAVERLQMWVKKRKEAEETIYREMVDRLRTDHRFGDRVLILDGEYPAGLLGILCSRLVQQFGKPAIVFTIEGEKAHGSARSFSGFSIYEAVYECRDLCERWGGHDLAAGMTIAKKDLDSFRERVNRFAQERCTKAPVPQKQIDHILSLSDMTLSLAKALMLFEPMGSGNPAPLFLIQGAELEEIRLLSEGQHAKLFFKAQGSSFSTILFQLSKNPFFFPVGTSLDLIGQVRVNRYRGNEEVEFRLLDFWPSDTDQAEYFRQREEVQAVMRGETMAPEEAESLYPQRQEFILVYQFLKKVPLLNQKQEAGLYEAYFRKKMPYGKWRVILEAFLQTGLLSMQPDGRNMQLLPANEKRNLEDCALLQSLKVNG